MLDRLLGMRSSAPERPDSPPSFFLPVRAAAGFRVDEDTALTLSAVWNAVKLISETIAMLPWRPIRSADGRRENLGASSLGILLDKCPNEEIGPFQLREFWLACALLHGNAYAEIESNRAGEPISLWGIHPDRVKPMRDQGAKLIYRVSQDNGSYVDIPPRQIFHLRGPSKDGIVGRSVISLARECLGVAIAAEQFSGAFFGNGAIPATVIEQGDSAPELNKEGAENLLKSFDRRHKGARRAGRTAFLEKGFTVKTIGVPQKDAQFLETRKHSVTEVARWFRVPPHKIGDLEKATFSNIEEQERNFVNDAILPWVVRLEEEADRKLVSEPNVATKLDVRGLMRGNNASRAEYYTKMRDLGVLSINEIRELEDLDPIEGGDIRLVPLNMVSLERAGAEGGTGAADPTDTGSDPKEASRAVLVEAHQRMMTKEAHALERARASKKDMQAWAIDFYARHEPQMREALTPGAQMVAALHGTDAASLAAIVESHVHLYCEASIAAVIAGAEVLTAGVGAETLRLINRITGARHA